jgi:S1-C subfamily serine protease
MWEPVTHRYRRGHAALDVHLNGKPITSSQPLAETIAGLTPGQKVPVEIKHSDGSTATVTVTIGQYPG